MDPTASSSPSSALVIWGSTGKRLQFTKQDLQMPEDVKVRSNVHFFEKQWDAIAGFWMNRVLKESSLQHMSVTDIVGCIVRDIERRWEQRKKDKVAYKKRKRLLDPTGTSAAGVPSKHVLLTNVVQLDVYQQLVADDKANELISAVVKKVEEIARGKVTSHVVLVDPCTAEGGEPAVKKERTEVIDKTEFDDRVAVVCTLGSKEQAATVVAALHGSTFDSHTVLCRFYEL